MSALEALLQAVGQLAVEVPELAEMDLNPVIMAPEGASCVDVKVRLSPPAGLADDGIPRTLRAIP